jgi:2'-5' RNA ligase
MAETALICRVPEAERYVSHYRRRFDPSARRGVPAHVTILYPFLPLEDIDDTVLAELHVIARKVHRFRYRLVEPKRFAVSVWLAPDPDESFNALTRGVVRSFPDYPPYSGKFETVVPHVTVAHGDEPLLCEIAVELRLALPQSVGIVAHCTELELIEDSAGDWRTLQVFPLGSDA